MTQRCYWFKCSTCDYVWWQHFSVPIISVPFLSRCTCSCPKCKTRTVAHTSEPNWSD